MENQTMKKCLACDIPLLGNAESLCIKCRNIHEIDHCEECNTPLDDGYKIGYLGRVLCERCLLNELAKGINL